MPVRSLRDGTLTIRSVGGVPLRTKVVDFMDGGLSWTERTTPVVIHRDRGVLDHARKGAEEALDGQFSYRYQDDDIRDTLVNLDFAGVAATNCYAQTVYAGWLNLATNAVLKAGATLFGRTIKAGDLIGGSRAQDTAVKSVNLLFNISDPAGGSAENILFYACHAIDVGFEEGDEYSTSTVSFESLVKQPHTYS